MANFLDKIIGELESKREWKETQARFKTLPDEYQVMYEEIKDYIWHGGTGTIDPTNVFKKLLERFEAGVAEGKDVRDVTGDDVVAFVDELAKDENKMPSYFDELREKLNKNVAKKLNK